MPKRIQMSRQHPWRAENPDAVIVARPSKLGNPFKVGEDYQVLVRDEYGGRADITIEDRADAVQVFRDWIDGLIDIPFAHRPSRETIRAELRGHDVACWCPLDQPCHADVLLEMANGRPTDV